MTLRAISVIRPAHRGIRSSLASGGVSVLFLCAQLRSDPQQYTGFLTVPAFPLFLSMRNFAKWNRKEIVSAFLLHTSTLLTRICYLDPHGPYWLHRQSFELLHVHQIPQPERRDRRRWRLCRRFRRKSVHQVLRGESLRHHGAYPQQHLPLIFI